MSKIVIPEEFLKREKLFKDIKAKHAADGASSPLIQFDVAGISTKVTDARSYHDQGEELSKKAEDFYEKRDIEMKFVMDELRRWAQFLKQIYRSNPRELGNWGYVVDDSTSDADEPTA